ncbi:hypothetical protein [Teichococcus deserti]|uniref:hypothetical protein n=1 Tax=Teichococcus deserti TaxID=1817963 RepID=UPI0009773DF9|nr:hypothetical protein [Pseudoroseomonas deserti]
MKPHRHTVGQNLMLLSAKSKGKALEIYTIVRLLPNDGTDREYRVRHQRDGHERVVRESDLRSPESPAVF